MPHEPYNASCGIATSCNFPLASAVNAHEMNCSATNSKRESEEDADEWDMLHFARCMWHLLKLT
ncbi:unnamed protein product [Ceratitis capitata]|uniref:(Mediterranean fruit fly) hypothetical protein n=1 Tax=Ceratitis capitata TaxID=7213 RepID=A0A811VD20_CERCA|nr:unnamed protein product [Ceratitis capitata]